MTTETAIRTVKFNRGAGDGTVVALEVLNSCTCRTWDKPRPGVAVVTTHECGCESEEYREHNGWDAGRDLYVRVRSRHVAAACFDCRTTRIGTDIEFVRFGTPVEFSRNHADGTAEEGMSCYEIVDGRAKLTGWHFDITERKAYRGVGTILSWGSDGEPLVKVKTIKPIRAAVRDELLSR